jgi:hypothetical protein
VSDPVDTLIKAVWAWREEAANNKPLLGDNWYMWTERIRQKERIIDSIMDKYFKAWQEEAKP